MPIPMQSVSKYAVFVPVHQTLEDQKSFNTERAALLVVESLLSTMGTISALAKSLDDVMAVSYTHLTLPTNREV